MATETSVDPLAWTDDTPTAKPQTTSQNGVTYLILAIGQKGSHEVIESREGQGVLMLSRSHYRPDPGKLEQKLADISRGGHLTQDQAFLIAASTSTASGHLDTTRLVLRLSRSRGVPRDALYEAVLQTYLFAGYPRAINALTELQAVFPETPSASIQTGADLESMDSWIHTGGRLCQRVYGSAFPKLVEFMERISSDLGRWMIVEGYGKVLSRSLLGGVTRELCAVGALLALHVPPQLRSHVRGSINLGASWEQVEAAVEVGSQLVPDQRLPALELLHACRSGLP